MNLNIDINKIHPHPDNPRRDLGDLSELADSIKESGILQNLTIVPEEIGYCKNCYRLDNYTIECKEGHKGAVPHRDLPCPDWEGVEKYIVVIGHRRLAAAKIAGLTEVPCTIAEMDKKTQVATMLLENMQRADLTIYEQAQGFQMMMDLGADIEEITKETGLSRTTVKNRTRLLEFDEDTFKEAETKGGTLNDYLEILKIEDADIRNEVLKDVGTNNFEWNLRRAISNEKTEKIKQKVLEKALSFAVLLPEEFEDNDYLYVASYYIHDTFDIDDLEIPKDATEKQYYLSVYSNSLRLYTDRPSEDIAEIEKEAEKKRKLQERIEKLKEVEKAVLSSIQNFVNGLSETQLKEHSDILIQSFIKMLFNGGRFSNETALESIGKKVPVGKYSWELSYEDYEDLKKYPLKIMLGSIYERYIPTCISFFYNDGTYRKEDDVLKFYKLAQELGYLVSNEEESFINGTHELYIVDDGHEEI